MIALFLTPPPLLVPHPCPQLAPLPTPRHLFCTTCLCRESIGDLWWLLGLGLKLRLSILVSPIVLQFLEYLFNVSLNSTLEFLNLKFIYRTMFGKTALF